MTSTYSCPDACIAYILQDLGSEEEEQRNWRGICIALLVIATVCSPHNHIRCPALAGTHDVKLHHRIHHWSNYITEYATGQIRSLNTPLVKLDHWSPK
ncbi:hypothetical protein CEXT_783861 [Caerostris extrusa]|uniref:Uncharacterized protein n=1 Tax=Caerostris extrusa TaxID=172846 RepID=A0AAV4NZV8_CAEEX|nr:hypothetical protein CEXT_783861 [Caerostris extrusa]